MSKPHQKIYSRTMFVVEGNSKAVLVTQGQRTSTRHFTFAGPEAALAWCRKHHAGLVYSPAQNPSLN